MINTEFNNILELIQAFPDDQTCIDHLTELRWEGNIVSPFDSTSKVYVCKGNKYKCKNTGKYFNVKTGTMFDNTKIKLQKWFLGIYLVTSHKKGISSIQLGKDIGVTQKSAWFMLQRIRACFGLDNNDSDKMEGVVQIDETYVGGKVSNMHVAKRKELRGENRRVKDDIKTPVFGMLEDGKVKAIKIDKPTTDILRNEMDKALSKESTIVTDGYRPYNTIGKEYKLHVKVDHTRNEYVNGVYHTNSIEGFWSLFKRGIIGIYHFASKKHLQKYLDEFSFRYNSRELNEGQRMNLLFQNTEVRTTYKSLING